MKSYKVRLQKGEDAFYVVVIRNTQGVSYQEEKTIFIACDANQKKYFVESAFRLQLKNLVEEEVEAPEELAKKANNLIKIWEQNG
jgi:hypothetical protein